MFSTVNIAKDDKSGQLSVSIVTERLVLESVKPDFLNAYISLFGSDENTAMYADGKPWSAEKATQRMNIWTTRWQQQNDPFSALAVSKNDVKGIIGHVVLGHGEQPGQSELAYLFDKPHWGQGYGKEAVTSVVKKYAPTLADKGYKVGGQDFTSIIATSDADNPASTKILSSVGMKRLPDEVKYGRNKHVFFIPVESLRNKDSKATTAQESSASSSASASSFSQA